MTTLNATTEFEGAAAELSKVEKARFEQSFMRQFVTPSNDAMMNYMYNQYKAEILAALQIVKRDFDNKAFGGDRPRSGEFSMEIMGARHWAQDTWDLTGLTGGAEADWLHSGLTILGGTNGNAIKIGEAIGHIILAIGDHSPSPKLAAAKFTHNGAEKVAIELEYHHRNAERAMRPLSKPLLVRPEDTFLATFFPGASGTSSPYLFGVSFLEEREAREIDPANQVNSDKWFTTT